MDSTKIQPAQVERLKGTLRRYLRFVNGLCGRMQQLGFPVDDPMCRAGLRAQQALQDLYMATHYAGCKSGVGKPAEGERADGHDG